MGSSGEPFKRALDWEYNPFAVVNDGGRVPVKNNAAYGVGRVGTRLPQMGAGGWPTHVFLRPLHQPQNHRAPSLNRFFDSRVGGREPQRASSPLPCPPHRQQRHVVHARIRSREPAQILEARRDHSRRVALIPAIFSDQDEGAPGPSLSGTGDSRLRDHRQEVHNRRFLALHERPTHSLSANRGVPLPHL